jgi:hypothetical protein
MDAAMRNCGYGNFFSVEAKKAQEHYRTEKRSEK